MSHRRQYYYRQRVTEGELNAGFDGLESADRAIMVDSAAIGIMSGLVAAQAVSPNLTTDISAGTAYDQQGRRLRVPSLQNLSVAVDYNNVSTTVAGVGNEKWLSVFLRFTRALSDPRVDGNAATIYFQQDESFQFYVTQGSEAGSGLATRPSLETDKILICDILRTYGDTTVSTADISTTRRQDAVVASFSGQEVRAANLPAAVQLLLERLMDHVNGTSSGMKQAAASVNYAGGPAWADGTTNPAATVEAQLDKIVSELAASAGADRIGAAALSGSYIALSAASIQDLLAAFVNYFDKDHTIAIPGAYPYTPGLESNINVDTTSARTIQLPVATQGLRFTIKDISGLAGTNNITVLQNAAETIDGLAASRILSTNWGSWTFIGDGTNWWMV